MAKKRDILKLAYSVTEMAEALSIGKTAAYELVKRKDFPKVMVGTRIIIPVTLLETWLVAQATVGTDTMP